MTDPDWPRQSTVPSTVSARLAVGFTQCAVVPLGSPQSASYFHREPHPSRFDSFISTNLAAQARLELPPGRGDLVRFRAIARCEPRDLLKSVTLYSFLLPPCLPFLPRRRYPRVSSATHQACHLISASPHHESLLLPFYRSSRCAADIHPFFSITLIYILISAFCT